MRENSESVRCANLDCKNFTRENVLVHFVLLCCVGQLSKRETLKSDGLERFLRKRSCFDLRLWNALRSQSKVSFSTEVLNNKVKVAREQVESVELQMQPRCAVVVLATQSR